MMRKLRRIFHHLFWTWGDRTAQLSEHRRSVLRTYVDMIPEHSPTVGGLLGANTFIEQLEGNMDELREQLIGEHWERRNHEPYSVN